MGQKLTGGCASFGWGSWVLSNTMWPRSRPTSVPSGNFMHPAVWPQYMGQKVVGYCPPFLGVMGPHVNNVAWAEAYLCTKWHLDPTSHLATTDMGRKLEEGCARLRRGKLGPHLTQCGLGLGLSPYQVATSSIQPFGHNTWAKKWAAAVPPFFC